MSDQRRDVVRRLAHGGGARASALVASALLLACASAQPPPRVEEDFQLERYLGTWYEIASFPTRFQRGCVATRADYSRRDDGRIRVVNSCRDGAFDGDLRRIEGVAWVADPDVSAARLEVQFFWPFTGDYWVLEVGPDYRWALVGDPSREFLWILSRTRSLGAREWADAVRRAADEGFDVDRLERTPQPTADTPDA